jgi:PPOX class probable F420-dependent enzyme
MPNTIPEKYADILSKPAFAHLATLMPDGTPQSSPVWIDRDGDKLVVNTARGRVKDENMSRDSRVAISVTDPENPYRTLMIRGKVVKGTEEGADAHIDAMAKKYLGKETYPFRGPGEVRVMYFIEPTSVSSWG